MTPPRQHRVRVHQRDVVVYELGDGPLLGYVHGMLGNPGAHPFLEHLARRHRVVAPCLPGFTGSDPGDDLHDMFDWVSVTSEIVDAVGLTGAPVVASSIGAMLALELQAIRPEAFDRMVLIAPLGLWDADRPIADLFALPKGAQAEALSSDPGRAVEFWEDEADLSADELVRRKVGRYHTRRAAAQLVWPIPDFGLASRIHRVACPVGLVWGARDRIVSPDYAGLFAKVLSGWTATETVDGAGHAVEWDAPDETAAAVELML